MLKLHVISGTATYSNLDASPTLIRTLEGDGIFLDNVADDNYRHVNYSKVTHRDNAASDGVVHIVDSVFFPPTNPAPGDSTHFPGS